MGIEYFKLMSARGLSILLSMIIGNDNNFEQEFPKILIGQNLIRYH